MLPSCRVLAPLALLTASAEPAVAADRDHRLRAPLRLMRPSDTGRPFEGLASLGHVLTGIVGLTDAQHDALARIEAAYRPRFRRCGDSLLALLEAATARGCAPAARDVMRLDHDAAALRQRELDQARAVLHDDGQRTRFDANVPMRLRA